MALRTTKVSQPDDERFAAEKKSSDDESTHFQEVGHEPTVDQYPHGLRLIILAGASIVAVFLIALDQVSALCRYISHSF